MSMIEQKVPTLGESITEVTIGQWHKKDGDYVEADELICELESDKASFEVVAEASGILHIVAQEGETVPIGGVICKIDTQAAGSSDKPAGDAKQESAAKESAADAPKPTGQVVEMKVQPLGESINEVVLGSWLKEDGAFVQTDEIIAEIESDKATFELPAEATGILRHVAKAGDTLKVGDLICKIEVMEGAPQSEEKTSAPAQETAGQGNDYAKGHPSPAAKKILDEKGIPYDQVKGTGPGGRITKEDALKAEKKTESKPTAANKAQEEAPAKPAAGSRNERRQRMSSLRKTIARRLVAVKNETAMLTTFNEVNMQPIMDLRKQYKDKFKEKYGVGLGFMSFFTKACCIALQEWPAVNARIDGDEIVYHDYCDISIAVSTDRGLVVPVIRNAEQMTFDEIEKEIIRLATKAREGKLSIEEMQGGTFTITNGGVFGSMLSTPIINAPQSAILGMHNIVERPIAVNGEVKIAPVMYVALSYDHRIIDGRESVSFLYRVKELLEDPARMLIGV
ncbi:2-oxoglutarate dehydrogenase complex dihydrolipoyllysine-residue succinyltransferase [Thermonema rossianum]|uniref:2-oxoglutarate dehydrogenase complex dihydrolipoyllysine-residue succinyltransferase n=1 Tax=Thermonema rossianum TaxID=55505 RepID=UPI00056E9AF1|nr:2-oxoglutarate dehydrogenase complex dihydrolipoyllysine-residue succinyltransferase [Thermonema rossianum]